MQSSLFRYVLVTVNVIGLLYTASASAITDDQKLCGRQAQIMQSIAEGRNSGKPKKVAAKEMMKGAEAIKNPDSRASMRLMLGMMIEMAYENASASPLELAVETYKGCMAGQLELKQ